MKIENLEIVNEKELSDVLFHSPKVDRETSGKITGFASIDKPWLKYYSEGADERKVPEVTLYEALLMSAEGHMDDVAFICADKDHRKVTFGEFIKLVDDTSRALKAMDVKKGDNITATFKDTIEGIALVFAKSRLGVIEHFIDPSNSIEAKGELLADSGSKIYFIEEDLIDTDLEFLKKNTGVKNIVVLPNLDSDDTNLDYSGTIKYSEFLEKGNDISLDEVHEFSRDEVSSIMYTGGSTGKPKGVMLTDYNFVAKYYREMFSDWKWGRGKTNLCVLPGIIAFGLSEGIISPLLAGETNILVDPLRIDRFSEYVMTEKPMHSACSPIHMEFLLNSPLIDDETDLSFIEMFPCGGDGMNIMADIKVREFLANHGASDVFAQGCGFTESDGAFCWGLGDRNKPGYMGIPLAGNVSAVFDPETGAELKYGEVGEWATLTDTAMQGYYGESAHLTSKALKRHADGKVWLHPGDMVHMNEDGMIKMHDRQSRTFNLMGLKIYPSSLELILTEHPAVKKCVLSGIKLPDNGLVAITDQKVPIVNLAIFDQFKGKEEDVVKELDDILKLKAPSYVNVFAYIFRDSLPYTNRGKIDYTLLDNEGISMGEDKKVLIKNM